MESLFAKRQGQDGPGTLVKLVNGDKRNRILFDDQLIEVVLVGLFLGRNTELEQWGYSMNRSLDHEYDTIFQLDL